ncbi:hypothetical protein [Parasedimentitalea denitrificans]|nr:hypothetical protein [Sedimentitalea sp. CY04]
MWLASGSVLATGWKQGAWLKWLAELVGLLAYLAVWRALGLAGLA